MAPIQVDHPPLAFVDGQEGASLEELVDRYSGAALAVAMRLLYDQQAAEDAVQDAFVKVVRNRGRYTAGRPFAPWFFSILRNVCLDELRRLKKRNAVHSLLSLFAETETVEHGAPVSLGLLGQLGPKEREVLYYRIVVGMSFEEAASAAGCSVEAAKKRSQRGLAELRRRLSEQV
jgi:RNA polymerase sigma-70 factor, ECF subfamily